jgi:hypothetical protein
MRSRFDPYTRGRIVGAVAAGSTIEGAAAHAGVPVDTVKTWLKRGRRETSGDYAGFAAAVDDARMDPLTERELVAMLERAAVQRGSVQACVFLLRRMDRERARQPKTETPFDALDEHSVITDLAARRLEREGAA